MTPHFRLLSKLSPISIEEKEYMACVLYASVIGSLRNAMVCTCPDISEALSAVSRFTSKSREDTPEDVKRVLCCLKGTLDMCPCFGGDTC